MMGTLVMVIQFFLSLSILVVLHEGGHYAAAKWFKTRVEKFYLFFNPYFSLFKKQIGETEYGIGWLPLGGYVKISGMVDESMDMEQMKAPPQPWEFRSKPAWQRLIIMLGGIIVNFILGFVIFAFMSFYYGKSYIPTSEVQNGIYIDSMGGAIGLHHGDKVLKVGDRDFDQFNDAIVVNEVLLNEARDILVERNGREVKLKVSEDQVAYLGSKKFRGQDLFTIPMPFELKGVDNEGPAADADLRAGDQVVTVNGISTPYYQDIKKAFQKNQGEQVELGILRNGTPMAKKLILSEHGTIGVEVFLQDHFYKVKHEKTGFLASFPAGVKEGINVLTTQFKAINQMTKGKMKVKESLGGPIAIARMFPKEFDGYKFWRMTAVLSMILGFMNLLPIPALDGGHVMFLLWEMISGKKPSDKFMEITTMIGFFILMGFMVLIFGLDIWNAIVG